MKKYRYILLDLDGTLTDPADGITNSIIYALSKYGISAKKEDLLHFIGPPLRDSFMDCFSFSAEQAEEAVAFYREYFSDKGIYENRIYPGVPGMLYNLKSRGKILFLVTSKPAVYARRILEFFDIDEFFHTVAGSNLDGTMGKKSELVDYALSVISGTEKKSAVMAGDRKYDIEGAIANSIDSIGVLWGYGSREELVGAGAVYIADSISDLEKLLMQ
jgi:phosphoglycolate phosphatase